MSLRCETCLFSSQCDGAEYAPFCLAELTHISPDSFASLETEKSFRKIDKALPLEKIKSTTNSDTESKSQQVDSLEGTDSSSLSDSYLYEYIFEACEYFSTQGYFCDSSEVFRLLETAGSLKNLKFDIKLLFQTCFVHGQKQQLAFDKTYDDFEKAFFHRQRRDAEIQRRKNDFNDRKQKLEQKIREQDAKKLRLLKEQESKGEPEEVKKARALEEKQKKIPDLDQCLSGQENLKNFVQKIKDGLKPNQTVLMKEIQAASKCACTKKNAAALMKAIQDRGRMLKAIKNNDSIESELKEIDRKTQEAKKQIEKEERQLQKTLQEITKERSIEHRQTFDHDSAHRAVHSKYEGDPCLDKDFRKMSEKEKQQVSDYIRENARSFRTRLTKKIRTNKAHQLDVPATIKKSCQTNGVPLQLVHRKPERQKAKLMLVLDVSGSCKEASELMLIFMHTMKEVFPGGCKTYAFTDKLYDISPFFETADADKAAKDILSAIPRAGVYSNYERPLETLYREHMNEVSGDSYVYFIGDARNNRNPSGSEYLKAIARKAKKAFWLNTEPKEKWDAGDSIMSVYAKYMSKIGQATTPAELLGFLEK